MPRTVFITGANSGVGLATTKLFVAEGWNVVGTARDTPNATKLQEFANAHEAAVLVVTLDVAHPETYGPAIQAATEKFGKVDVLINNAGYGQFGPMEGLTTDDYRRQFEVNVFGPIELTKSLVAHFRETGCSDTPPTIIYISSGGAHFGLPMFSAYMGSKAAMNLVAECISYELAQLSPPIIVKLVTIHGGVKSTNFAASSNSAQPFANVQDSDRGEGSDAGGIFKRYETYISNLMGVFGKMSGRSMEVEQAAGKVYEAAVDKSRKLRYFVVAEGAGDNLLARMDLTQDGEDPDDVDERYMANMRGRFLYST